VPVPAGEVAVMVVELTAVMLLADVVPNLTAVAPVKFAPVMVTDVPPAVGPLVGEIPTMAGGARLIREKVAADRPVTAAVTP